MYLPFRDCYYNTDIEAKIQRRQRRDGEPRPLVSYNSLPPVAHTDDPVNCGPVLERLLDYPDPVFDGHLSPDVYVYRPEGSGKLTVVAALFDRLVRVSSINSAAIHMMARVQATFTPRFVYVGARETTNAFTFYHAALDALVDEPVPKQGIKTEALQSRLKNTLDGPKTGAVAAVGHLEESGALDGEAFVGLCVGLPSKVSWLVIGRAPPDEMVLTDYTTGTIQSEPYQSQVLVNVLMTRVLAAGSRRTLSHRLARSITGWVDDDAHDTLVALFDTADEAVCNQHRSVTATDITDGIAVIPQPCVSLGRVFSLPENRRQVLHELLALRPDQQQSVWATSQHIAKSVDLPSTTVRRILYEFTEGGTTRRVTAERVERKGRPPSWFEPRFPTVVFEQLFVVQ